MNWNLCILLFVIAFAPLVGRRSAATETQDAETPVVAATVDGRAIHLRDVKRELARMLQDREVETEAEPILLATALERLVDRERILLWLERHQRAATQQDVQHAITRLTKRLQQRERTLDEHLERLGMSREELAGALEWQLSWQRFLDRFLTDENLERYFRDHRREFDGTRLRVAHILFEVQPPGDEEALEAAVSEANRVRQQIRSGQLTFDQAAKEHSVAPTGETGGDLGLIGRHEPMPEVFSRAAFALEEDEISEPVMTPFGVHLIQCLEVEPGRKPWQEVRSQLEEAVTRYLFDWAADQARDEAEVEFTGAVPRRSTAKAKLGGGD